MDKTEIKASLAPILAGSGVWAKFGKNQLSWVKLGLRIQQICLPNYTFPGGWLAGLTENKANLAPSLGWGLGLSLAKNNLF